VRRRDWLLAFLAVEPAGQAQVLAAGQGAALDPIRVMKGIFLFQNQNPAEQRAPLADAPYEFEPYAYGPFTPTIYSDLDELAAHGLVEKLPIPGRTYARWRLTAPGRVHVAGLLEQREIPGDALDRLRTAKRLVLTKNFAGLLRHVYARYPEYARESVAQL
jgi:hypothetical protein